MKSGLSNSVMEILTGLPCTVVRPSSFLASPLPPLLRCPSADSGVEWNNRHRDCWFTRSSLANAELSCARRTTKCTQRQCLARSALDACRSKYLMTSCFICSVTLISMNISIGLPLSILNNTNPTNRLIMSQDIC